MSEDTERTVSRAAPPGNGPAQRTARQRRPTGAPPPLPHPVKVSTTAWRVGGADIASGRSVFWLDSDQAGPRAVTVTLSAACDVSGIQAEPSDQPGTQRFDGPPIVGTRFTGLRVYTFPGGCASYRFDFAAGASSLLIPAVDGTVAFMPRVRLVNYVRDQEGLALCGRGASCPG
jgi:hypothetical protein